MKKCSSTAYGGLLRALCLLLVVVMLSGMVWAGMAITASAEEPAAETQYGYKTVSQTGDYVHFDISGIMPADAELKMDFVGQDYYDYILASLGKSSLAENEFLYVYDLGLTSPTVEDIRPAGEYAVQFYLNEANISVDNMGVVPVAPYNDFLARQAAAEAEKTEADAAAAAAEDITAPIEDAAAAEDETAPAEAEAPAAPVETETAAPVENVTAPEDAAVAAEVAPAEDSAEAPAAPVETETAAPVENVTAPEDAAAAAETAPAEDSAEAPAEAAPAVEAEIEEAPVASVPVVTARAASAVSYSADKSAAWFNINALGTFAIYGTKFDRSAPVADETPAVDNSLPEKAPAADDTALAYSYYQRLMEVQSVAEMVSILSEEEFANVKMTAEQLGDISFLLDALPEDEENYEDNYEAAFTLLFAAAGEFTDDEPTTLAITGERTVEVGKSITLTSNNGSYSNSWSSSDPNVATVEGNGRSATVTGVSAAEKVTITHSYKNGWYGRQYSETYTVTVTAPQAAEYEGAQVYYLKTPTSDPDSNDTDQWGENVGTAQVNTTNATWTDNKNIMKGPETLDPYIISWPDGTTGQSWVLPKSTYPQHYNAIFGAYQAELQKELGVELKEEDVEEITLIPYKISKDNGTSPDKHIDCTISVKCKNVFVARFNVEFPGDSGYTNVLAKNYRTGTSIDKYNNPNRVPIEMVRNDITYVFDGWYNEAGDKVADSNWPYLPNDIELADGTVYFYARYIPKPVEMTIYKAFVGLGSDVTTPEVKVNVTADGYSEDVTLNSDNNYTYTLTGLNPTLTYTVEEQEVTIPNYRFTDVSYTGLTNGVITPSQTGDNTVTITNTYEPDTTSLTVTKHVTGNFGDKAKQFDFTVTVKLNNADATFKVNGTEQTGSYQFKLADNGNIVITDIPVGATVTVTEADYGDGKGGYTTTHKVKGVDGDGPVATWTAELSENNTIEFTNYKRENPDTGINLDSLPYRLVLAVVVAGVAIIIVRKQRRSYDD